MIAEHLGFGQNRLDSAGWLLTAWRRGATRECCPVVWRRCASCTCVRSELHLYAAPAKAEFISWTLRRHTRRLLLRQQGRCGVTLEDCCCGSRDVAASHSQTAVAAAETFQLPEFSAEQRWSQRRPSIDCESSWVIALRAPVVSKIPS